MSNTSNALTLRSFSLLGVLAASLSSGCAAESRDAAETEPVQAGTDALSRGRIAELKSQIAVISRENTKRIDNMVEVSAQLGPLVAELQRLAPAQTQAQTADYLEGAWHQLWSNLEMMGPGFLRQDLTEVFQVVSKDHYYYNFGSDCAFGFFPATGILRGKYQATTTGLEIEFTKVGFRVGTINEERDLVAYTKKFELNGKRVISIGRGQAPKGPVGIKGHLTTLYVDEDFRIAGGDQTPFTDDTGKVLVPGRDHLLFVLERHLPSARHF